MSQETERYQLENNGNTYLVRTPAGSGGGADVEANPEGTATEDLEKLQVGETIYGLPPVVGANPVLAGTEPNLTSLQIGDTKYAVESGMTNPMTTAGDIIYAGANGTPTRLASANPASGYFMYLGMSNSNVPSWAYLSIASIMSGSGTKFAVPYAQSTTPTQTMATGTIGNNIPLFPLTTAPTADNTDGLKIVVLTSEPAQRFNGWWYIILSQRGELWQ